MNLILLTPDELGPQDTVTLTGRRAEHVLTVHRANVGDRLRVGVLGGQMGQADVLALGEGQVVLRLGELNVPPPPRLPVTVILALPRPKMLKRIYQTVATLGVERLVLLHSYRVEKSFWSSPWLAPAAIHEHLYLGLEQGVDTVLPEVCLRRRFKPFVEDELPALAAGRRCLVAHPTGAEACPQGQAQPTVLAIGPEGGFIPYEVERLAEQGFTPVSLGPRILRVETAVTALLARLF